MRRVQQEIDDQLAAEKSSIVAKHKVDGTRKESKAKPTTNAKSKGKNKSKSKLKGKNKVKERAKEKVKEKSEGHSEL